MIRLFPWLVAASGLAASAPAWSAGCIASGSEQAINAALVAAGSEAVLCPGAVFLLKAPVVLDRKSVV